MSDNKEPASSTFSNSLPIRIFILAGLLLSAVAIFGIIDHVFTYFTAKSYVDQIADTFDLNSHLAGAFTIVAFALLTYFFGKVLSVRKHSRLVGYAGILTLLVANSLLLWRGSASNLFDRSGNAIKCYVLTKEGIRYSERPGIDPETGRLCRPVTAQIVERLRAYEKGLRPRKITEQNPPFFDALTGEPVVWYAKRSDGIIELFDLMGYHPDTGEELSPVTRSVVETWKQQRASESQAKCYIIVGDTVRYGNSPGVDAATGKECREIKPGLIERLRAYEQGKRPNRVTGQNITFFDPRTGAPIVWYSKSSSGDIELFDLMGFHPETGQELLPITPEVVNDYRSQQDKLTARPPQKVDPKSYAFFDPLTGAPRAWYWKSPDGTYEFFDSAGYHPITGDPLAIVTKSVIEDWRKQEEQQKIERDKKTEEEFKAKAKAEELATAGDDCDRLAGNPTDAERNPNIAGRTWDDLQLSRGDAISACERAIANDPTVDRYKYQLARASQMSDTPKALALYGQLVAKNYAAAFDNYGWVLLQRQPTAFALAARYFRKGAELGNSDAMESLAELINKKKISGDRQEAMRLMQRAAQLGNQDAQKFLLENQQKAEEEAQQKEMVKQIFQGILGRMSR